MSTPVLLAADIEKCLYRISKEILEDAQLGREFILVGIHSRGVPLALRISQAIAESLAGINVPTAALDITLFRDDQAVRPKLLKQSTMPLPSLDNVSVVLVDDVLFTGRTIRAALDALGEYGRPRLVRLAVLVDRGHRELPIRADYVGKNLPSAASQSIRVRLRELDGVDEVAIEE